jgi:acyl transferase domain-containing protein
VIDNRYESAIAIIGMSGRFPGAAGVDELWDNLMEGRSGLRTVSDEELADAGVSPAALADPAYVRTAGPVDGIDQFDAAVFGFSRREAETMDPQHRLFLECSWEALESAGYPPTDVPGRVGVFGGCGYPDYAIRVAARLAAESGGQLLMAVGNERDSLTSMVSYKLGLRGPSLTVQTFCSSSLVAVHLAAQSLLTFESDVAIAGGAYVALPQPVGFLYEEGSILTPDGRVRSFDAAARGTVLGNGVCVVALKRMTEALADGDPIHAVILGSAVNNDGRACAGYTAPGVDGQAEAIKLALSVAGVKSETIGYVECHATGTVLGDSIEVAALERVFARPPVTPCVLGALKPSIGHLDRASGVAGLIRTTLALGKRILPGTPGFQTPNPVLAAAADRFTVLAEAQPWLPADHPRRAGVSSFGFGGTNAHVILEEAPERPVPQPRPGPQLLVFSARDLTALHAGIERLTRHLSTHRDLDLADVAYTLQQSRTGFMLRWTAIVDDVDDALSALGDVDRWTVGQTSRSDAPVVLVPPEPSDPDHAWWRELSKVADHVIPAPGAAHADGPAVSDPAAAHRAVAAVLRALGVNIVESTGYPSPDAGGGAATADSAAVRLTLERRRDESALTWLLETIARLWRNGVGIDWARLHPGSARRVPLPTYPFQRRRYWLDPVPSGGRATLTGRTRHPEQWTYLPSWRQRNDELTDVSDRVRAAGPWLVLVGDGYGEALVRQLLEVGADVTAVRLGDGFARTSTGDFVIRPDSREDLGQLIGALVFAPRRIVHALSLSTPPAGGSAGDPARQFDEAQAYGYHSILAQVKAFDRRGGPQPEEVLLLTDGAVGVFGADLRHPEHASLAALAPVLSQENPAVRYRHVDVDVAEQRVRGRLGELARCVLAEAVSTYAGPVAWRGMRRWVRAYEPQPLPAPDPGAGPIAEESTVLITGGLGKVGLVLADHLATSRGCRLVLTARSAIPPRERWEEHLARDLGRSDKTSRYLRQVLELERRGADVLAVSADVADVEQMTAVVRAARQRFGTIDAVVHGAGVQDGEFFGLAHEVERSVSQAHFAAKVHGFHALQGALAGVPVKRRITLSSLSAVLGGITLGPYAAANAALDAYATVARDGGAGSWLTVDWDAWRIAPAAGAAAKTTVSGFELSGPEGVDIFERALASADHVGHLVVSTGVLSERLEQWVIRAATQDPGAGSDAELERTLERDPRPDLPTPFVAPAEGVESALAEIWASALRLDRVGAEDDFYLLGGDSIVAIELISQIRKRLGLALPVTVLLEDASVRSLAQRLDEISERDE